MSFKRVVITVDGLAGSGKSTLSHLLAQKLGFVHLYSGQLYRAVAWLVREHGVESDDQTAILKLVGGHRIDLALDEAQQSRAKVNGRDITELIHNPEISELTSQLAAKAYVRSALLEAQREAYPCRNLVAEGRDMGTVVFPAAALKFFITASEEIRTKRRLAQLNRNTSHNVGVEGERALEQEIRQEIIERDKRDIHRLISPSTPAADAITIDNSSQTLTYVVERMYDAVLARGIVTPISGVPRIKE